MTAVDPNTSVSKRSTIETWIPGSQALHTEQMGWRPRDLEAGLDLSALLVLQGMAYKQLAGRPAIMGLYTRYLHTMAGSCLGLAAAGVRSQFNGLGVAGFIVLVDGCFDRP